MRKEHLRQSCRCIPSRGMSAWPSGVIDLWNRARRPRFFRCCAILLPRTPLARYIRARRASCSSKGRLRRRVAHWRSLASGASPAASVSVSGLQGASLSRAYRSPVLASAQASLGVAEAARWKRRLPGSLGSGGGRDASSMTGDSEVWSAHRKALTNLVKGDKRGGRSKKVGNVKGCGGKLEGAIARTG